MNFRTMKTQQNISSVLPISKSNLIQYLSSPKETDVCMFLSISPPAVCV